MRIGIKSSIYLFTFLLFRGTEILPKYLDQKRFLIYGAQAFGIPMLMLVIVVFYDRLSEVERSDDRYDPGFGEESCWFTSCSKSLSLFLYGLVF